MHPVLAATMNRCLVAEGLRETREEARHGGRIRVDGRLPSAARPTSLVLRRTRKAASAVLSLGRTQILAEVVGELVQPFLDKPSEGMLTFSVNYKVVLAEEGRVDVALHDVLLLLRERVL